MNCINIASKFLFIMFLSTFLNFTTFSNSHAQDNPAKQQFIYKLKLIPELLDQNNWTEKENNIVGIHFKYLQNLEAEGTLIMAGRTLNNDESQFGIVVFFAENLAEAEKIYKNDPAVINKIMTAELFPFRVALLNAGK